MIKLTTVHTKFEAESITTLLKSRGIYTFVEDAKPENRVVVDLFARRPPTIEVWVIMDAQYSDAMALLNDPDHEVIQPSTDREMELMEELEKKEFSPATISVLKFATVIFCGSIILCVIAYWLRAR